MKTKRLLLILSLCYGLNLFGQIPSSIPQNGLVAYYPFDGNANDISGSGNNGVINESVVSVPNRFAEPDKALSFNRFLYDGESTGVVCQNNNIQFAREDMSISLWYKINTGLPSSSALGFYDFKTIFQTGNINTEILNNTVSNYRVSIGSVLTGFGTSHLYFSFSENWGISMLNSAVAYANVYPLSTNVWTNLTVVIRSSLESSLLPNTGNVTFYINGVLASDNVMNTIDYYANSVPPGANPTSFSIGADVDGNYPFDGAIDNIAIYNRAMQADEILSIFSNGLFDHSNQDNNQIPTNPAPPGIPYQAVARNMQGEPVSNSNVQVRFSIRDSNTQGPVVYSETHSLQTDTLGLFSTAIGSGTPSNNGNFNQINWSQTIKYLQVELDFGNGWTDFGTQQLMSVPYALYAGNSQPGPQGPAGPRGITGLTGLDGPQGEQGPIGLSGANGATGPQGEQGVAGTNGKNSLVKTSVEPSGATCPTGGVKMEHGLDTNNDGVLDESEINATLTQYVCNGTGNIVNQLPIGGKEGQSLTICNGIAKWTYNGQCFTIDSLNCQSAVVNGSLTSGLPSEQVILSIPYYTTETGIYKSQLINSSGINGLIANLNSGELMADSGMLNLNISGIPSNPGIANFQVVFGEKQCNIEVPVSSISEIQISDNFGGGIVAYILQPGDIGYSEGQQHGIIVAPYDQSNVSVWGCYGSVVGGTSEEIGTGKSNTNYILMGCEQSGTAAMICDNLQLNGFSDWYLPSIKELEKIYQNLHLNGIGNFSDCGPSCNYWSSSEHYNSGGTTCARTVFFDGYLNGDGGFDFGTLYYKNYSGYVRAVRSF